MKILIIEDEPGIISFLKQGLEEEHFEVQTSANGKDGLELMLGESSDLVLLDWMLPGLPGIEVCKRFREQNSTTPVIFLTARDTVHDTIAGLQSGANDYIKKPFHFEELLERIRVQLRTSLKEPAVLKLADIQIDVNRHLVVRSGKEIYLTQKEYELLEYLLRNKDKVCTRKEIIENVWNIHFDYNTSVIDVFMNSLRKKLGLHKQDDLIHTIRGVGFIARES